MTTLKSFAIQSSLLLAAMGSMAPAGAADLRAIVDATVRPLMLEHNIAGMAVGVTVDGTAHYFHYGLASRESKTPVTSDTLFELGSVSKTLTATLASYAHTMGRLSLDDHPGKFMPQLKGSALDKATILHLGTYTAGGLPLQFPDDVDVAGMSTYFRQFTPEAVPGARRVYSNPSLGLFGHLSALALNTSFADAMEQQLFPQLGLKTSYLRMPPAAMGHYAWGYNRSDKPVRMSAGVMAAETYGVRSNVVDMVRFVQVNLDPGLLQPPMRRAVQGTHVGYFQTGEMLQGLGWEQYAPPVTLERLLAGNSETMIFDAVATRAIKPPQAPSAGTLFNKTGSTGGFGSYIVFVPQQKIGIVLLANKNYPIPARVKAAHAMLTRLAVK